MRNFVFGGIMHANLYTFCADYGLNILVLKEILGEVGDLEKAVELYKEKYTKDGNLHLQDLKLLNVSSDSSFKGDEKQSRAKNNASSDALKYRKKTGGSRTARDYKLPYKGTTYPTLTKFCKDKGYNYNSFMTIYYRYRDLEKAEEHFLNPKKFVTRKKKVELIKIDNMAESLSLMYNGVAYDSPESFCKEKGYKVEEFGVIFDTVKSLEKAEKLYLKSKQSGHGKVGGTVQEGQKGEDNEMLNVANFEVDGIKYRSIMQFCRLNNFEVNLMYALVKKYETLDIARKVYFLVKSKRVSRKQALQGLEIDFINDLFETALLLDKENNRGELKLVRPENNSDAPKKKGRKPKEKGMSSEEVNSDKAPKKRGRKSKEGVKSTRGTKGMRVIADNIETNELPSSESDSETKVESVPVFPMYKGRYYDSRSALCDSVGISKRLVDDLAERLNISDDLWMTLLHTLDKAFSSLSGTRPSFIENLPVVIINETWFNNERSALGYLGIPKQVYDLTDNSLSMAKRLTSLEGMKIPVETSKYDHDVFSWGCRFKFTDTDAWIKSSLSSFGFSEKIE